MAGMTVWLWVGVVITAALMACVLLCVALHRRLRRRRVWRAVVILPVMILVSLSAIVAVPTGYLAWCRWGGLPDQVSETWRPGVSYERIVLENGPVVVHLIRIDTAAQPVTFTTNISPMGGGRVRCLAQPLTRHMRDLDCDLAINASFFRQFHEATPWDYYPKPGDIVEPVGVTRSGQRQFGQVAPRRASINLWPDGRFTFGPADDDAPIVLTGEAFLVRDGVAVPAPDWLPNQDKPYPFSVVGRDTRGRLVLLAVDGKQPGYSVGLTRVALSELLIDRGITEAINFDGGGSTTLGRRARLGQPFVINRPIHTQIPRRQRPIANILGIQFQDASSNGEKDNKAEQP